MELTKTHTLNAVIKTPKDLKTFNYLYQKVSEVFYDCEVLSFGIIDPEDGEIAINLRISGTFLMTLFLTKDGTVHGSREGFPSNNTSHLFFRGIVMRCEKNPEIQEVCTLITSQSFVLYENFRIEI